MMSQQQAVAALATARERITVVAAGSPPRLRAGLAEANQIIASLEAELRLEDERRSLVADAAEAQERYGDDELEAYAAHTPESRANGYGRDVGCTCKPEEAPR
jgi:hypothetical protein